MGRYILLREAERRVLSLLEWLRLPNLMDRSRAYWRGLLRWIVFGERNEDAARFSRRERAIFAAFGLASFFYTTALMVLIVVSEREIGGLGLGHPARLKVRAYPDHTFRGEVSKIGGESELDQNRQATYRVESILHFYAGKTGTEKCRTEKYGPMISQIFIEPFRAGFLHEELRAAGEFSPIHLISEPENLQKENFERVVIWREIRQLHLMNYRGQLAKSVPTEASA